MSYQLLGEEWATAWGSALNASAAFQAAAGGFSGAIGLLMEAEETAGVGAERAVLVELERGRCRAAHAVRHEGLRSARYVLRATPAVWAGVLDGSIDPVQAVLGGRLRLARGSLLTITPHLAMARELLLTARTIATVPPTERA